MRSRWLLCSTMFAFWSCSPKPAIVPDESLALSFFDGTSRSAESSRHAAAAGTAGMIVADDRIAAEWGAQILRKGGNAADALVATAFTMAVTRPHYASVGGGGFLVYCPKPGKRKPSSCEAIDFREKAPAGASRDMYLRDGKPVPELSRDGALASGVPGVPAGLLLALDRYGTQSRASLLSRPIRLAREGMRMSTITERAANSRWNAMNSEAKRIWGCGSPNHACGPGTLIRQPDLARVLESVSRYGKNGFYKGWVARKLSEGIGKSGGILTARDLSEYEPRVRIPVTGSFSVYEVVSMPPPSSGGTILLQLLHFAELARTAGQLADGPGSARTLHALSHGMALSFADRAKFFGDPDFVSVPIAKLLSPEYESSRWNAFEPERASHPTKPGAIEDDPGHTTHLSVIDRHGNAAAMTLTVNDDFGSGFVPPGTGVVMNNQMDDFSAAPGAPNLFGLVGAEANSISPGKRPLSSMAPTIVRDSEGNVRFVIGAAGGPRIITSVFQVLVNRIFFGMSLQDAIGAPRFHHQWKPDRISVERFGFAREVREKLVRMGYAVEPAGRLGVSHALERFPNGRVWGAPDPRGEGAAVAE